MARLFRSFAPKRGGDASWSSPNPHGVILRNEFFGKILFADVSITFDTLTIVADAESAFPGVSTDVIITLDTLTISSDADVLVQIAATVTLDTLTIDANAEAVFIGADAGVVITLDTMTISADAYVAPEGYAPPSFDLSGRRDGHTGTATTDVATRTETDRDGTHVMTEIVATSVVALTGATSTVYGSA